MAVKLDHGDDSLGELHEINVTPFIDVILVLLIIFMIAAPLATVDVPVDLPSSTTQPQPRTDKPVFLTVKSDLSLAVGEETVARAALASALETATKGNRDDREEQAPLVAVHAHTISQTPGDLSAIASSR